MERILKGLPPTTPHTDDVASNGNEGDDDEDSTMAFDAAAVTGVSNELPGQSPFGRSLLMRQLCRGFSELATGVDADTVGGSGEGAVY